MKYLTIAGYTVVLITLLLLSKYTKFILYPIFKNNFIKKSDIEYKQIFVFSCLNSFKSRCYSSPGVQEVISIPG